MSDRETRTFPCPRCGAPVRWGGEARWKPFCSERCKLIDLGAWFMEEHAIPGEPVADGDARDGQGEED